ncbi:DUF945 family protein [uncultured Gilvimarinus sp.]|uniref:DUF945 family protein n=1 Tax=uncultured Gilvimarinus sp. TaxID=1689143 RepID=UPI0030EC6C2F|tara:strand:- start:1318 stop:2640 length:1323 start_codon:yes stop_codon:yes gene_type:complete
MKKFLGLILLVLAYVGLSYYSGMVGEQYINDQVELSRAQASNANVTLDVTQYERGIFQSNFDFSAKANTEQFAIDSVTIDAKAQVFHGPIIFADGIKFGWFYARTDNTITTSDTELNTLLGGVLPQGLGRLNLLGEYGGSYDANWRTEVIEFIDEDGQVHVDGVDVHSEGRFDSLDSQSTIIIGAINASHSDGTEIGVTPIHANVDMEFIAPQVPLSSGKLQFDALTLKSPEGMTTAIRNIEVMQRQRLENEKVDTKVRMSAEQVEGMMPMSNLYYELELNQVTQEAMATWAELSPKLQSEEDYATYEQEIRSALTQLLHKDLVILMSSGGEAMNGYVNTKMDLHYVPPGNGRSLASVTEVEDYLRLVKGSGQVVISKEIMTGTPLIMLLAPYMDTYIVQQGDEYVLNARLNDGKLWLGDTPIELAPMINSYLAAPAPTP